jgi:3-hydroxybutyryl-CoA dehydrogenase
MDVVILGANEDALSLALSWKNKAGFITFIEQDQELLENIQYELGNGQGEISGSMSKFIFTSSFHIETNGLAVIFDFLPDNEEKINLLKQLYIEVSSDSVFFTTSKLFSVSKIASLIQDPRTVVGLQYLQSFEKSRVIELVKGIHTTTKTLEKANWLMSQMDKEITIVKDSPGFLLNRMTVVLINEAIHLLNEGISSPHDIDKEMELALGLTLGPLRLADLIGLDNVLNMLNSLYQGTGNPKFLPCSLLQNMVYSGYLGKKTNSGFYSYSAEILNFPHLNAY